MAIEIRGLTLLTWKLKRVGGRDALQRPMTKAVYHLLDAIAKYPPETSANRPPGNNGYSWYERGFGRRTITGKAYPTSQMLGRKWTSQIFDRGRKGVVGNNVTYAPAVQKDGYQAAFHARNGWKTDATVAREERPTVVGFFQDEIAELLSQK